MKIFALLGLALATDEVPHDPEALAFCHNACQGIRDCNVRIIRFYKGPNLASPAPATVQTVSTPPTRTVTLTICAGMLAPGLIRYPLIICFFPNYF